MGNSFKKLWEEEEQRFTLPLNNNMSDFQLIGRRIEQQQQTRRFNGDVADLFLPRMIRAVIGMFGGEVASDSDNGSFDRPAPSDGRRNEQSKPGSPGMGKLK
jgi:hypothetical protein